MVRAAIAGEDSKFCQHDGFDLEAIEDAMQRNASGGRIRGGSTISQQTAKNAFLWQGGGYVRKGLEAWFTFLIEAMWAKRRIMEVYLNLAETGIGTYGVNAGAQRYFGHDASAMSRDRGGADRRGPAAAQEARRGRAQGLHPALWRHHRGADRRGRAATGSTPASTGHHAAQGQGPAAEPRRRASCRARNMRRRNRCRRSRRRSRSYAASMSRCCPSRIGRANAAEPVPAADRTRRPKCRRRPRTARTEPEPQTLAYVARPTERRCGPIR